MRAGWLLFPQVDVNVVGCGTVTEKVASRDRWHGAGLLFGPQREIGQTAHSVGVDTVGHSASVGAHSAPGRARLLEPGLLALASLPAFPLLCPRFGEEEAGFSFICGGVPRAQPPVRSDVTAAVVRLELRL